MNFRISSKNENLCNLSTNNKKIHSLNFLLFCSYVGVYIWQFRFVFVMMYQNICSQTRFDSNSNMRRLPHWPTSTHRHKRCHVCAVYVHICLVVKINQNKLRDKYCLSASDFDFVQRFKNFSFIFIWIKVNYWWMSSLKKLHLSRIWIAFNVTIEWEKICTWYCRWDDLYLSDLTVFFLNVLENSIHKNLFKKIENRAKFSEICIYLSIEFVI